MLISKVSRGSAAAKAGIASELELHSIATKRGFANGSPAGTKKSSVDVPIRLWVCTVCKTSRIVGMNVCPCGSHSYSDVTTGIEKKNSKTTTESAGKKCVIRDMQVFLDPFYSQFHSAPVYEGVPSAILGIDKSIETWNTEKSKFPNRYIDVSGTDHIANYYRTSGSSYIETPYGLYHTGVDVFNWNVPYFAVSCRIRVRPKQHGSSAVPQDIQACLNFNAKSIAPSPFTLATVPVVGSPLLTTS